MATTANDLPAKDSTQLRRAVASSFLGSVIEYYDFLLYATAAALVFGPVFFSDMDPLAATVASFGTFAAGYLARPLGGLVFGHFGDRLGRKRMLILTMTVMGTVSFAIGLLPTYDQIGNAAPIALVLLRVLQGIAVGGEWGGAMLMSAEHASTRRGLWASFTSAGAPCGMVLSTAALTATGALVGEDAFLAWGWRVPFLFSVLLLAVGLFVRLKVEETPVFAEARSTSTSTTATARPTLPVLEVLRQPRNLVLAVGVGFAAFVAQATLTTFLISYGVQEGFPRQTVLNALTLSSGCAVVGIIGWSALSDRVGRRPVVLAGSLLMIGYSFALFPMVGTGSAVVLTVALVLGQGLIHPMMYGPLAALYAELFSTRSRYTGASLGYQIAGLGAGIAPLLFAEVQRVTGGGGTGAISVTIAVFCAVTVVCILAVAETSTTSLREPASEPAARARSATNG